MQTVAERTFVRYFTDVDLLDVGFTKSGRHLGDFRLNYRAYIEGDWHEVIRYDSAHGQRLHVHRFWPPHHGTKEYLEKRRRTDYTVASEEALRDLEDNWDRYRKKMVDHVHRERKKEGQA